LHFKCTFVIGYNRRHEAVTKELVRPPRNNGQKLLTKTSFSTPWMTGCSKTPKDGKFKNTLSFKGTVFKVKGKAVPVTGREDR
jgi:hypothetical protein